MHPTPRTYWYESDESLLGAPFYVMERVAGRIPTDNPPCHAGGWMTEIGTDERSAIWWSGVDTLAAIHRCDPARLGIDFLDAPPANTDTVRCHPDSWRRYCDWVIGDGKFPTLGAGWQWLVANRSPGSPAATPRWRAGEQGSAAHVAFWEAFSAWRFAVILVRVGHQMQSIGVLPADSNFPADNTASRLLAKTLDLPRPA